MKYDELVNKAFVFARIKHAGQLDDCGKEYFTVHIRHVVDILEKVTTDPVIIAAAYLHDTLEDTHTDYLELKSAFGEEVADLVHEVTHEGNKTDYYFPRLHSQKGIILKFADRLSNVSRMETWNEERKARYLKKSKFWASTGGDSIDKV